MDSAYPTKKVEDTAEDDIGETGASAAKAEASLTILGMKASQCKSVRAHAVEHNGARDDWIANQAVEDLETVGLRSDRIVLKSDQEASVTALVKEIAPTKRS